LGQFLAQGRGGQKQIFFGLFYPEKTQGFFLKKGGGARGQNFWGGAIFFLRGRVFCFRFGGQEGGKNPPALWEKFFTGPGAPKKNLGGGNFFFPFWGHGETFWGEKGGGGGPLWFYQGPQPAKKNPHLYFLKKGFGHFGIFGGRLIIFLRPFFGGAACLCFAVLWVFGGGKKPNCGFF